jgi:hypothetical protein
MSWKYSCAFAAACGLGLGLSATLARGELVLTVNRVTGATTLTNETGAAFALDNYAIRSNANELNPAGWSSFATSGLAGPGWLAANVSDNQLAELRISGQHNFANGASLALGNAVKPLPLYSIDPGISLEVFPLGNDPPIGTVNFFGQRNNIVLTVNPYSGAASIRNESSSPVQLDNYSILSLTGGLDPVTWTSLAEAGQAGWQEANPTSTGLNELRLSGVTTLNAGATLNLGNPYRNDGYRDLNVEFTPFGFTDLKRAYVDYVGAPTAGQEIRLENVTVSSVSSEIGGGFNRQAEYLLDGSGVNVSESTHGIAPDSGIMWLNGGFGFTANDANPFIVFDLGDIVDVTKMKIWNYNEDPAPAAFLPGRGVDQFTVSVATTEGGPFTSIGNFSLDIAPGAANVEFGETFTLNRDDVRFVRFDILSNHNGVVYPAVGGEFDAAFVGLSEVQFFGLAEASGPLGDTNGDGVVDIVDLNNVRNNFGASGLGDTNNDGTVDITDLNNVRNNFGAVAGSAVPEPASLLLALCAGIGALASRRRLA